MMQGAPYVFLSMMPVLAPADYQRGTAYSYSYTAVLNGAASLWYVCTYVGHAQSGMYGLIELS